MLQMLMWTKGLEVVLDNNIDGTEFVDKLRFASHRDGRQDD